MIELRRKQKATLPEVHQSGLDSGSVYVGSNMNPDGSTYGPDLKNGVRAVLETANGNRLELITSNVMNPRPTARGTYVSSTDFAKVGDPTHATLRRYWWLDTFRKAWSYAGAIVILTAATALLTAVATLTFAWFTYSNASAAAVIADRASVIFEWVRQPADDLPSNPTADQMAAAREDLDSRVRNAAWCLQSVLGNQAPAASIPSVECASSKTPWWQSSAFGALITGVLGIATAFLGLANLRSRFGFQKSPGS